MLELLEKQLGSDYFILNPVKSNRKKKKNYKRPEMFSQPVTQLMCFFKWKSNDDWESNGFPPDQIQALVSFFIYLPIYLFIFIYREGN